MKFTKQPRQSAKEYEAAVTRYWKENKTFEKSVEIRPADNAYVFYDGPPFITGVPHHGTLLSSVVKDAVPRYWTMKGKRVERVWGWDCHGLPAEVFTEKKLGIKDKSEVGTKISLEEYINTCRANMIQTGSEWEDTIDRIGRWVDFKGAYKTMDANFMESVWWGFKQLWEAGKIYEGEKVLLYCTRDATPISKAEVAMDNSYQDITDPSVFVKFKLTDNSIKTLGLQQMHGLDAEQGSGEEQSGVYENVHGTSTAANDAAMRQDVYLLAWTTTPWTLVANTAVAVNAAETYAQVRLGDERFILAEKLLDKVLTDEKHQLLDYTVEHLIHGRDLVGLTYDPLFEDRGENAHKVWAADYVGVEEGTGIVHLAPAYGEEDYDLARRHKIPVLSVIDDNGHYTEGPWKDQLVWEVNKPIAKTLLEEGKVFKIEYITHSYPHCHRCGTKLMYRAHPSWFLNVDAQKERMLELNGSINWFPEHIKTKRFKNTVESAPDWNISRDRFWATPMPVWKGTDTEGKEHIKVVGSYEELEELSGQRLEDYHRPWVDDVTFELDGIKYTRIDKVLDCWFESGSMPYAQFHYPFENKEKFEANFPGDFIAEYVGQVRAWFYYLHAVSTALFDKQSFKNVIVTGVLAGNDGRKMSKSFGNFTDPNELMDSLSADALRFFYLSSPLLNGEDVALLDKDVADIHRKLSMLWNVHDFFTTYAEVDGWSFDKAEENGWDGSLEDPTQALTNTLDLWIVARLHQFISEVDSLMMAYDVPRATKPVLEFLDDLSNWYVRRSRKRFWKSESDSDKQDAYKTLHYVMVQTCKVIAPFTPFMAEAIYQELTGRESVHLENFPSVNKPDDASLKLLEEMQKVRTVITEGLSQRAKAQIKVRQPLASVSLPGEVSDELTEIIAEELNVKEVRQGGENLELDLNVTPELKCEGIARDLIRFVQNARKNAGFNVDDRILLRLQSEDTEITDAAKRFQNMIFAETLATSELADTPEYTEVVKLDSKEITLSLSRAS